MVKVSFLGLAMMATLALLHAAQPVQRPPRPGDDLAHLLSDADRLAAEYRLESTRAALSKYQEAIRLLDASGDRVGVVRATLRLAQVYRNLGNAPQWVMQLEMAAEKAKETQDRVLEVEAVATLGAALLRKGDTLIAKEKLARITELGAAVPGLQADAHRLQLSALIEYQIGDASLALEQFQRVVPIWDALNNKRNVADATRYSAAVDAVMSRTDSALLRGQAAVDLSRSINDKGREAESLITLGNLETRVGRKQEALNSYEKARAIVDLSGDLINEQSLLSGMARTYFDLGDIDTAFRFFKRYLDLSKTLDDKYSVAVAQRGIGQSYLANNDPQNALNHLISALDGFRQVANRRLETVALIDIGSIDEALGNRADALGYLNHAVELSKSLGDPRLEATALLGIGHILETEAQLDPALQSYEQALELSEASADSRERLTALYRIADSLRRLGRLEEALMRTESALSAIETLRSSMANTGLRTAYFASVRQQYELFIDLLMGLKRRNGPVSDELRALEASERSRARTLLDNINETRVSISEGVDPKQLEREASLRRSLDAAIDRYTKLRTTNAAAPNLQQLSEDVQRLTKEYEELQGQIRVRSPRYAALVQPEPLNLAQIQNNILDPDSLLLEYSVGEENTYLWAVTPTEFSSYVLPKRAEIDKRVRRLRDLIAARVAMPNEKPTDFQARVKAADAQYTQAAAELSQMLLGPVAEKLGTKRLVIVGEGVLQYLPFAALPTPHSAQTPAPVPLVAEHEIVSLPSASTLAVIRREAPARGTPDRTLAVFADPVFEVKDSRVRRTPIAQTLRGSDALGPRIDFPRLPSTRQEADAILAMVPENRRMGALGFKATKAAAMNPDLKRYRIVHFATHTALDDEHPDLSSLVLSLVDEKGNPQSGFLRLRDMYNLSLSAELVVLSACDTALGKEVKGEGLMSMVRGFMYSGTPRVLASLWKVDDEATAELMKEFYKHLLQEGMTPAASLRQAQITQMQKKSRQSPYYWAGFQLQGEWK
jgi:CHAT domain-containing protein